jgi:sporulation protein YlmC with PRC-barrel domain
MAKEYDRPVMSSTPSGADVERDVRDDWDDGRWDEVRRVIRANKIQGDRVRNSAGDDLGKIEDIMIDVSRGRIAYAVLSFGGFLGMGNKLFAIPWEALSLNQRDNFFVLNVSKERLEKAPGFDKDNWPDMADPGWGSDLYSYYGYRPYWER